MAKTHTLAPGRTQSLLLRAGHTLTLNSTADASGLVVRGRIFDEDDAEPAPTESTPITPGVVQCFGDYRFDAQFVLTSTAGTVIFSTAPNSLAVASFSKEGNALMNGRGEAYLNFNEDRNLVASVMLRTNTLANLKAMTSGGSEICVASDVEAIVVLRGAAGSGTAMAHGPVDPEYFRSYDPLVPGGANLTTDQIYLTGSIIGWVEAGQEPLPMQIIAGGSQTGPGADLDLRSGDGVVGGNVLIRGGQTGGNVQLLSPDGAIGITVAGYSDAEISFFGATPIEKPTVTGSRGGNTALASLLTQLDNLGLITNETT